MTKLYLIGSLRNDNVPKLAQSLRTKLPEIEVFDDWYAAGPEADDYWKAYEQQRGRSYEDALKGYAARNVFAFDRTHLDSSTHALLVLPAGKSGHMEIMYAKYGVRANAAIYLEPGADVRYDVMYQFVDRVIEKEEDIAKWIEETSYSDKAGSKYNYIVKDNPSRVVARGGYLPLRDGDGGRFARLLSECASRDQSAFEASGYEAYAGAAAALGSKKVDRSSQQDYATFSRQR